MALGDITLINNKEYIDLTPKMTSNTAPSPYTVSATSENSSRYTYMAFDGNTETYYRSSVNFTKGYVQMYFGEEVICNCYTLTAGNTAWTMRDWVFQGSKDGKTWETLHIVDGMTSWVDVATVHTFEFENNNAYSYYRIYCSKQNGANSICIGELKFYKSRGTTMTFHKVLEENLPSKVTSENDEIYFTDEGNIYISKKDGTLMKIGGSGGSGGALKKVKLEVLTDGQTEFETRIEPTKSINDMAFYLVVNNNIYIDEISTALNQDGKVVVTFDNAKFDLETTDVIYLLYSDARDIPSGGNVDVDLTDYMDKVTYASDVNDGNVKKSDSALKIDGVEKTQPLTYYGTDVNGNVGFHILPVDLGEDGDVEQRVLLNVKNGESYTMQSKSDISESKAIVQVYKFVQGEQDIISTIKEFNNGEKDNFYYDKSNISFNEGCSIKKQHSIIVTKNDMFYISDEINKNDFMDDIYIEEVV